MTAARAAVRWRSAIWTSRGAVAAGERRQHLLVLADDPAARGRQPQVRGAIRLRRVPEAPHVLADRPEGRQVEQPEVEAAVRDEHARHVAVVHGGLDRVVAGGEAGQLGRLRCRAVLEQLGLEQLAHAIDLRQVVDAHPRDEVAALLLVRDEPLRLEQAERLAQRAP